MRASNRIASLLILLLLTLSLAPLAAAETAAAPHIERIAQAGRLWGFVKYLHPYPAYKDIDWDRALVDALPRIREARTPEEHAAAVQSMLAVLGDPVTRVLELEKKDEKDPRDGKDGKDGKGGTPEVLRIVEGGVAVLDLGVAGEMEPSQLFQQIEEIAQQLSAAPAVVVDLRGMQGYGGYYANVLLDEIRGSLVSRPSRAPNQRYLLHSGYRPQDGGSSGGYYSGFLTLSADVYDPPAGAAPKRVVFLTTPGAPVPPLALALQSAGTGSLVSEGEINEESIVQTRTLEIGDGLWAQVRVSELVPLAGWSGFRVDAQVEAGKSAEALTAALAEARKPPAAVAPAGSAVQPLPDPVFRLDPTYPEMKAPDLPHRWLAVVRAWSVIHYFYPYLHLLDDWNPVLPEFLARMETAETGRDYALAIQEMMACVADGHTSVSGHPELLQFFGEVGLPLEIRWMEGAPVITGIYHDSLREAGIEIGDALVAVDGEPVAERMERWWKYMAGSTETTVRQRTIRSLTRGAPGSTAVLSLQGIDGAVREVRVVRERRPYTPPPANGETVRILPGNIGYMDLTRLQVEEVAAAFETVKSTRGLVFDMRGYPNGTAWSIAPRINTLNAKVGAQFRRSQVSAFSAEEGDAGFYFAQPLPPLPPTASKYTRPTVMLIDDRAISQSEHSGLFYEAANGTRFIGTPTAGANGDVTTFTLPGGLLVRFTGHDVRHADGSQLQRKGLIPHVEVAPTRAGLRAGKDEVLDRALQDLEQTIAQHDNNQEKKAP